MFRRRASSEPDEVVEVDGGVPDDVDGPWDSDRTPDDGLERVDLGSLRVPPREGTELRLQVDENTGEVQSVMLAAEEGALELRAFAAPRNGDLWTEVRPQIAADISGTAAPRPSARAVGAPSWSARCRWCCPTGARPCSRPGSSA